MQNRTSLLLQAKDIVRKSISMTPEKEASIISKLLDILQENHENIMNKLDEKEVINVFKHIISFGILIVNFIKKQKNINAVSEICQLTGVVKDETVELDSTDMYYIMEKITKEKNKINFIYEKYLGTVGQVSDIFVPISQKYATNSVSEDELRMSIESTLIQFVFYFIDTIFCSTEESKDTYSAKALVKQYYYTNTSYKTGCPNATMSQNVLIKLDYMLEYIKNKFIFTFYQKYKDQINLEKICIELPSYIYVVIMYVLTKQNSKREIPYVLIKEELEKIINDNIDRLYSFNFDIKKEVDNMKPNCESFVLPSPLSGLISLDHLSISRMISYKNMENNLYDKNSILIIEKTKCVFYDIFIVVTYKIYRIIKKYENFVKANPEKIEMSDKLKDLLYFYSEDKLIEMIRDITSYNVSYDKYCILSDIKTHS